MSQTIKIAFAATDFANVNYMSIDDCACARAVRRHFHANKNDVSIGGFDATVRPPNGELTNYRFVATYLNDDRIDNRGFGVQALRQLCEAFDAHPTTTTAHLLVEPIQY